LRSLNNKEFKNMIKKILYLLLFVFIQISLFSQNAPKSPHNNPIEVSGLVVDQNTNNGLPGAHVSFISQRDSSNIYRTATDAQGYYKISLPRGAYKITATFLGYNPQELIVKVNQQSARIETIKLRFTDAMLDEFVVTEKAPTVQQKNDTIQYNATAFKTNPDASAEDLVKKMPGISVDGSGIKAQGEDVQKVLVDGQEFFGDDASIALKNLPAEMIEQVQVFDKLSDQAQLTGFNDGQTTKTINIVTRSEKRSGQFGKVYGGYGDKQQYQAGINTNIFHNKQRISILGIANNVNQQNFSSEDLSGFMGSSSRGGGMRGGSGPRGGGSFGRNDFMVNQQNGINTTHSIGLNYTDVWYNKVNVNSSYFFNSSKNVSEQFTDRQYFISNEATQMYLDSSSSSSKNFNHRFNARIEYKIDDNNTVIFSPRISYQNTNSNSLSNASSFLAEEVLLNQSITDYERLWDGYNMSGNLVYRLKINDNGRSLSSSISANANNNEYLYFLDASNSYFQDNTLVNELIDQKSNTLSNNASYQGNLSYTEPLGKNGLLQLSYNLSLSDNASDRMTNSFDIISQSYIIAEDDLSGLISNGYLTNRGSLGYRLRNDKFNFNADLSYQDASLTANQSTPYVYKVERSFKSILPRLHFTYNFSKTKNLRLVYRTYTNAPSASQLQDVVDNTNPLLLSSGNPDLNQTYSHFMMSRFSLGNPANNTSFLLFLMATLSDNYIGSSVFIAPKDTILSNGVSLPKGSQFSQPINLDGYSNLRSMISYGFMVDPIKTNLNFNAGLTYSHTPSIINNLTNIANSYNANAGIVLSSNISEKIDFTLSYNAAYNLVKNTIRPQLDNTYFLHTSSLRFNWIFLNNWVLRNDLNNLLYSGMGEGFDQNYWLWNINFGKKFLKNNQAELTLGVYDLLDQNKSLVQNVSASYIENIKSNVLNRFFMLTFTYNIRNFKF